jgi:hypothetical protein
MQREHCSWQGIATLQQQQHGSDWLPAAATTVRAAGSRLARDREVHLLALTGFEAWRDFPGLSSGPCC